jgi:hypothetical protein
MALAERTRRAIYALSPEYETSSRDLRRATGKVLVSDIPIEVEEGWRNVPVYLDGYKVGGAKFNPSGPQGPIIVVFAADWKESKKGRLVPIAPSFSSFVDKVVHEAVHAHDHFAEEIRTPKGLRLKINPRLRRTRALLEKVRARLERHPHKPEVIEDRYRILATEVLDDPEVRAELYDIGAFRGGEFDTLLKLAEQTYRNHWRKRLVEGSLADLDTAKGKRLYERATAEWGALYPNTEKELRAHTAQLAEQVIQLEVKRGSKDVEEILAGRLRLTDVVMYLIMQTPMAQSLVWAHLTSDRRVRMFVGVMDAFSSRFLQRPLRGLRKAVR